MTPPLPFPTGRVPLRLKGSGAYAAYHRARHRRALAATLEPQHDRVAHRQRVRQAQDRERAAAVERELGYGTSAEALADLFGRIEVLDPGLPLVRVGSGVDGGYLVPDDLDGVTACFSPGVAGEIGFDLALAERGIPVHLVDASVPGLPTEHPLLDFEPLFLGPRTAPGWTSLPDWVARREPGDGDLLLEMDIEGHEWGVLLATPPQVLRRFRMLVVELHDLHALAHPSGFATISAVFETVLRDFALVHVHQNNHEYPVPYNGYVIHPVVEVTFLRRDRLRDARRRTSLVDPLDRPNTLALPDAPLDPAWL